MPPIIDYREALNDLARDAFQTAASKGFHNDDHPAEIDIPRKLALIHSEASEALDTLREPYDDDDLDPISGMTPMQEDDFTTEIADIIIRCLDLCASYELDIGDAVLNKMAKNQGRIFKHGKNF